MSNTKQERLAQRNKAVEALRAILEQEYVMTAVADYGGEVVARFEPRVKILTPPPDKERIVREMAQSGIPARVDDAEGGFYVRLRFPEHSQIPWKNIILFALTVVTVFFVPQYYYYAEVMMLDLNREPLGILEWLVSPSLWYVGWGLRFAGWLLAILLAHEFGHYFAGRRRGIRLTLPFFIPFPLNFLGTLGAVIRFKSPIENKRDLIEVGAAGPIAGFVVAVVAAIVGLAQTDPSVRGLFSFENESLIMLALGKLMLSEEAFTGAIRLAPAAFAAWIGFLVTALNMIPLSQLDGGHVTYGLFGAGQRRIAVLALIGLFFGGFIFPVWWVYGALAFVFGPFHPPTLHDQKPPGKTAQILGWVALVIFLLTLNIAPFGEPPG